MRLSLWKVWKVLLKQSLKWIIICGIFYTVYHHKVHASDQNDVICNRLQRNLLWFDLLLFSPLCTQLVCLLHTVLVTQIPSNTPTHRSPPSSWHYLPTSTDLSDRVRKEKSFQNSKTFHKPFKYGMEKQHEGTQLFRTSGKGAQPLL